ncbi:hypothetical protein [Microcoleus sp. CAWBG58]|uniref:hypothetical protein n=1 Tax=Microcoleus sp. CAWBG58 TaxID=2841651 RepID=UPI0025D3DB77|nr:hypothetical protein [Microcoleus sp. CAWBG58]
MYTLEALQSKTFKQLKEIGYELNVLPAGNKTYRQTWIDAIVGVNPPLLELLEVSPGVKVEPVAEAIEVQPTEPIESKFGRTAYPKPAVKPIAPADKNSPGVSFDVDEFQQTHVAEIEAYFSDDRPPNRGIGDRGRLENEPKLSQSEIVPATKNLPRSESDLNPILTGVTFSDNFLARYSPPKTENIHYQVGADGQLSLLDFEVESVDEPPDFDDYSTEFEFWAAYDAWCDRNPDDFDSIDAFSQLPAPSGVENPESPAVSMDSMREWAPCPEDWYDEPTAEILPLEASSMPEVLEPSQANEIIEIIETSSTCKFLIPVFGAAGDRQNDKDEPPDGGSFARLPKPKPPSFPPMSVVAGDRANRIKKFARGAILSSGRSPPGGDASF